MPVSSIARRVRADEWLQEMTTGAGPQSFRSTACPLRRMQSSRPGAVSPQELRLVPSKLNEEP
jgi:hypothetical protein